MPSIATLTMNPALDISTTIDRIEHTHKLRCGPPRYDPGGGGINVARAVKLLGGEAAVVYPAGGPIGEMIRGLLDSLGLVQHIVSISGATRESFTVDELETGKQYRFVLPGPMISESEQRQCLNSVEALKPHPKYLVVSGSLPPGVGAAAFSEQIAKLAERIGARLVLDTAQAMPHARRGVFLMKPSRRELSGMLGRPIDSRTEQLAAARSLVREGRAEVIVVSLGADGALLVTGSTEEHFQAPAVATSSSVGAGDSMVGAIVFALERGWAIKDAVRYGIAAGAAATMRPGTQLCRREDVERLFRSARR
jgi:6-phosphofructokinase 2